MKRYKMNFVAASAFVAVCGFMAACAREKALTPSVVTTMSRFEFPEGDTEADEIFQEIYEKYDVRIIYKGWTKRDWERGWTNEASGFLSSPSRGRHFENGVIDTLDIAAKFMRDEFFAYLDEELVRKTMYPYIYLVNSYGTNSQYYVCGQVAHAEGLDYRICAPWSQRASASEPGYPAMLDPSDTFGRYDVRIQMLWNVFFKLAFAKGGISYIPDLNVGLDTTTDLDTDSETSPNYYKKRGYIQFAKLDIINYNYRLETKDANDIKLYDGMLAILGEPQVYPRAYAGKEGSERLSRDYLLLALHYDRSQMVANYGAYPLVMDRYERTLAWFKERGIDLEAIAAK